jgi:chromatin segregation and condensation protein Rec8/ScpA/Scc1 (kleisin family)
MHKFMTKTIAAFTLALMLPATFLVAETSEQTRNRKEAVQITKHIEATARKIQTEADHLDAMKRSSLISSRSHQEKLNRIAVQVNEQLNPAFDRLAELQPDLPKWNQYAIDQMRASAASLASGTNSAILNRNDAGHAKPVTMDENYATIVNKISTHAGTLVQLADAAGDYGQAQLKGASTGLAIQSHD